MRSALVIVFREKMLSSTPFKEKVAHISLLVGGASVPYGFDKLSRYSRNMIWPRPPLALDPN